MAVRIVENCCSPLFLDFVRHQVEQSDRWNFKYPMNTPFDEKHAKLEIIGGQGAPDQRLAGIAMSLMIQIYEMASDIITPNIMFCGASIKDKYRKDNPRSKLKTAVTNCKVKPGTKAYKRQKAFCSRSRSWKGERGKAARRRWKC